jgi:two-component system, cell cycle response regulator
VSSTVVLFLLGLAAGALCAAVGAALREHRRARRLAGEVVAAREDAAMLERRDDTTGLYNSRFFVETLTREIERARTYGRPLALALASVGEDEHPDSLLRDLGAAVGGSVRAMDMACRVGSVEFGVIMPETDSRSASVASERVLRAVARAGSQGGRRPTAAVGIAACPAHADTFEELIERAGAALRSAREAVRDDAASKPGTVTVSMAVWDDGEPLETD